MLGPEHPDDWPELSDPTWEGVAHHVVTHGPTVVVVGGRRLVVCHEAELPLLSRALVAATRPPTPARTRPSPERQWESLTPRQREVATLAAAGQRPVEIGLTLGIATQTVRVHLNAVRVHYRAATVAAALQSFTSGRDQPSRTG